MLGGASQKAARAAANLGESRKSKFSKADSERIIALAVVSGVLAEYFKASSYSYTAYLQHDSLIVLLPYFHTSCES